METNYTLVKLIVKIRDMIDPRIRIIALFVLALLQFSGVLLPDEYRGWWLILLTPVSMFLIWMESIGVKRKYQLTFYACIAVQAVCLCVTIARKFWSLLSVLF